MQAASNSTSMPPLDSTGATAGIGANQGGRSATQSGEKFAAALRGTESKPLAQKENCRNPETSGDATSVAEAAPPSSAPSAGSRSEKVQGKVDASDPNSSQTTPATADAAEGQPVSADQGGNNVPAWLPEWLVMTGVVNADAGKPQPVTTSNSADAAGLANTSGVSLALTEIAMPGQSANPKTVTLQPGAATAALPAVPELPTQAAPGDAPRAQQAPEPTPVFDSQLLKHEAISGADLDTQFSTLNVSADTSRTTDAQLMLSRIDPGLAGSVTMNSPAPVATPVASAAVVPQPMPTNAALSVPMTDPRWQDAFAAQISWQARDGIQHVSLALNPAELGPVEVRLSVNDGQVSAQFHTAHQSVRQVIEDAMPKLRDMLSQSGLNLADANVFQQQSRRDQQTGQLDTPWSTNAGEAADESQAVAGAQAVSVVHQGLIDAYI